MNENEISYVVRGCIFTTFNKLGPGLLESTYEHALAYEIKKAGLISRQQVAFPLVYESVHLNAGFRADLIVQEKVIVEIKSVENLMEVHHKQLLTYLRLSGIKLGLLVNFNCSNIASSVFRKVNNL